MRGQLSAEMLILITVVLAVVAIVAMQMIGTAEKTGATLGNQTDMLSQRTMEAMKSPENGLCMEEDGSDCQAGLVCIDNRCRRI
jgi:uncharacterized protein (UPF0333 family)